MNKWLKHKLADIHNEFDYSIDAILFLTTVKEKYVRMYEKFITESSKGNVDNSGMDTAYGNCLSCLGTDHVSVQTACKKYRKREWASCKLSKCNHWMETK